MLQIIYYLYFVTRSLFTQLTVRSRTQAYQCNTVGNGIRVHQTSKHFNQGAVTYHVQIKVVTQQIYRTDILMISAKSG